MEEFLRGMITMGFAVAGLFFQRYWKETNDRLFLFFAMAFYVLAVNRFLLTLLPSEHESYAMLYWVRFLAFLLIVVAIVDKNRSVMKASQR